MIEASNKPCEECPFRKRSFAGWLGPWASPEELLLVAFSDGEDVSGHGHPGFVCHMTIDSDDERNPRKEKLCAGSLICANKSHKLFRNEHVAQLAAAFEDDDNVMTAWEFNEHHGSKSNGGQNA